MDIYNTLSGALVLGAMLLMGSGVVFVFTCLARALRTARSRARAGRILRSALGVALLTALWIGFGHYTVRTAYKPQPVPIPSQEFRWKPVTPLPTTSFDRFDYGSATNAELARRS